MFQFFLFVLIICSAVWGSAFVFALVGRLSKRVEPGNQEAMIAMLREEMESLTGRLGQVEDELDFYKRLQAPDEPEVSLLREEPGDPES